MTNQPQSQQQLTPMQYAAQALDLSSKNLSQALAKAGNEITVDQLIQLSEVQTRMALASALMDASMAVREGNNRNAVFSGLERVANAITAAGAARGFGDTSQRI
jgi:predicted exporter